MIPSIELPTGQTAEGSLAQLGLGTAALGRPAYITTGHGKDLRGQTTVDAMSSNAWSLFDAAYGAGVRYFDTARSYGHAESFLATWIESRSPSDIFVASKWGYAYVADWNISADVHEVKDHTLDAFRRQLSTTQSLLGGNLNLYQIHSVTPASPVFTDTKLLAELARLKDTGVGVGLSTSGPQQRQVLEQVGEHEVDGVPLFDAVQTTWNLLETSAANALQNLSNAGVVVVIKEALANGRLGPDGDKAHIATCEGPLPADAQAIAAALHQPFCDVALSGAVTTSQLHSNLDALAMQPDSRSEHDVSIEPETYWQQRGERPWT